MAGSRTTQIPRRRGEPLEANDPAATRFCDTRAADIAALVQQSLWSRQSQTECLQVEQINQAYQQLDRTSVPVNELRGLRFLLQHWRSSTAKTLVARLEADPKAGLWVSQLNALRIALTNQQISFLARSLGADSLAAVLAHQGNSAWNARFFGPRGILGSAGADQVRRAGPSGSVPIDPVHASRWPFDRWSENPMLGFYRPTPRGVCYREVEFRSGDFVLCDLNTTPAGVYAALTRPVSCFHHFGMVVILESGRLLLPAVIEMHSHGVRAVPLSVFLSRTFVTYAEVYRFRYDSWPPELQRRVMELLHSEQGFDYRVAGGDGSHFTCATMGSVIANRVNLPAIEPKSFLPHGTADNLRRFGVYAERCLTPTDYMVDERVRFVGLVDNDSLIQGVTNDLVVQSVGRLMEDRAVNVDELPISYMLLKNLIEHVQAGTVWGRLFLKMEGFSTRCFPVGPAEVIAFSQVLNARVGRAIRSGLRSLPEGTAEGDRPILIDELEATDTVTAWLEPLMGPIRRLFK